MMRRSTLLFGACAIAGASISAANALATAMADRNLTEVGDPALAGFNHTDLGIIRDESGVADGRAENTGRALAHPFIDFSLDQEALRAAGHDPIGFDVAPMMSLPENFAALVAGAAADRVDDTVIEGNAATPRSADDPDVLLAVPAVAGLGLLVGGLFLRRSIRRARRRDRHVRHSVIRP